MKRGGVPALRVLCERLASDLQVVDPAGWMADALNTLSWAPLPSALAV